MKKIKIFRSSSRFILQLFSTIEIVSVVVTIEQQTIFRTDLLFLFNNFNIFLMNSNSNSSEKYFFEFKFEFSKMIEFFRVQVRVRSPGQQQLATAATFLRSCANVALSCGGRPRRSLHFSAFYHEYFCIVYLH